MTLFLSRLRSLDCRTHACTALAAVAIVLAIGCSHSSSDDAGPAASSAGDTRPAAAAAPAASAPDQPSQVSPNSRPRIVILGDSLTAGYGLQLVSDSFPGRLQQHLDDAGLNYEIVNMGVSGDTSAGGLRRLD